MAMQLFDRVQAPGCPVGLGQMDEARSAIAEFLRLALENSMKRGVYGHVAYTRASYRERYADGLRKAELPEERPLLAITRSRM